MSTKALVDQRGRQLNNDRRIEPGWSGRDLGRAFGAVASSREVQRHDPAADAVPLPVEELAEMITSQDQALSEPAPSNPFLAAPITVGSTRLLLEPLAPSIGTVVHGVDLKKPLAEDMVSFLRDLWLQRKVIFFRDQHLSDEEHAAFAAQFGVLGSYFGEPIDGEPIDGGSRSLKIGTLQSESGTGGAVSADNWHSDASWAEKPPMCSILRCLECPAIGGDTHFCDAYAMYEGLSKPLKLALEKVDCLHQGYRLHRGTNKEDPTWVHPALRTHPETKRTALFVSPQFTKEVVGMGKQDSDSLLMQCWLSAGRPEYSCRFRWQPGSIAMWDNRCVLHYAAGDFWPHNRKMRRICIVDHVEERKIPYFDPPAAAAAEAASKL